MPRIERALWGRLRAFKFSSAVSHILEIVSEDFRGGMLVDTVVEKTTQQNKETSRSGC